jgi:hypothetical protein
VHLLTHSRFTRLEPGQTRPIPFRLDLLNTNTSSLKITIRYDNKHAERANSYVEDARELDFLVKLKKQSRYSPQKVTHLHPGGIVSYAVLRPPSRKATCLPNVKAAPILLQFHGAGVEADNEMVSHSLDSLPDLCAWVLFPTAVTPWSADDWRTC